MADTIKMTDGELAEVRMLQEKFQQKIFELGRLYLQKLQIESTSRNIVEQEWVPLQKMENELMDKLLKKYGEGSLDLGAGSFIPEKKPTS
jgi:16S rRNA U516 pseudouridylate synthase RsuA-like enzyme